jgi:hypothetical protein
MAEDARAVAGEMPVEGDAVGAATEKLGEPRLAVLERSPAKVLTVELDEVECTQHGGVIMKPIPESVKYREAALVGHNSLAIDPAVSTGRLSIAAAIFGYRSVKSVPWRVEEAHAIPIASGEDAEAVVLDLVNPIGS